MPDFYTRGSASCAQEVYENIYRIPVILPNSPLKALNSYLIRDPGRSLLVDTGFRIPACKEALLAGLAELGEAPGSVDIFVTHLHADHSGLAADIAGDGCRIFMGEPDADLMENLPMPVGKWVWNEMRDTLAGMPREMVESMDEINPAIMFAPPQGVQYNSVKDGDIIRVGGYTLRCILTPGHTPGHMCLWDEGSGVMFTGDQVLFDITPNITTWPGVEDSLGDYLDSLRKIREYPVKAALPGHRKTGDFHARIDELLRHHETRITEVESIVRSGSGLTAFEVASKMRWKIQASGWDDFPITQKIFAVGECLSHLDYLRVRGRIIRRLEGSVYAWAAT